MTGMLISGKMSTGVRSSTTGNSRMMASAITTKVYGLRSANRTIHINSCLLFYIGGARYRYGPLTYHRFNLDSWERLFGYAAHPVEIHCAISAFATIPMSPHSNRMWRIKPHAVY